MPIYVNDKLRTDVVIEELTTHADRQGAYAIGRRAPGDRFTIDTLRITVPGVVTPPPGGNEKYRWEGAWAEMDQSQHEDGSTEIGNFHGRADVLRCTANRVRAGGPKPTKANREKHFPAALEGDTILVEFDLFIEEIGDLSAYRTWADIETLSVNGNPGWRISDKSGNLAFNDKFAAGKNYTAPGGSPLVTGAWQTINAECLLHRSAGKCRIQRDSMIVVDYNGPTMGDYPTERVQFGIAQDGANRRVVACYSAPLIVVRQ